MLRLQSISTLICLMGGLSLCSGHEHKHHRHLRKSKRSLSYVSKGHTAPDVFKNPVSIVGEYIWPTAAEQAVDSIIQEIKDTPILQERIVGGVEASRGEYEAFALLMRQVPNDGRWQTGACGASLVGKCWAITAAHCVYGSDDELIEDSLGVYVNAYAPYDQNDGQVKHISTVSEVIAHPLYVATDPNQKYDMALLRLEVCADPTFVPFELLIPSVSRAGDLTVMGLGHTAEGGGGTVRRLRKVEVPFIPNNQCNGYYSSTGFKVTDDMLCAGYREGAKDACQGDSGGPIIKMINGIPHQVGVVSWGIGCARAERPGVYSSVGSQWEWLKKKICDSQHQDLKICGGSGAGFLQAPGQESGGVMCKEDSRSKFILPNGHYYVCSDMAEGNDGNEYCYEENKHGTPGYEFCPKSCNPSCI